MNNSNMLAVLLALLCFFMVVHFDLQRRQMSLRRAVKTSPLACLDIFCTGTALSLTIWTLAGFAVSYFSTSPASALVTASCGAMFAYLWGEGRRANQFQRPSGIVLGEFLVLGAIILLLLRAVAHKHPLLNPWSLGSFVSGGLLLAWIVPRFLRKREEHHILDRINQQGEIQQPEYAPPTQECPHPERWKMMDSMSAEVEILDFLKQLVLTLKPTLIVETGTFIGASTIKMAEALKANGFGKIITCEFDPVVYSKAKDRIEASGVSAWIEARNQSSLEMRIEGTIDLFFSDSHLPIREEEIRRFLPQIVPNGLIVMHDTSSHYKIAREAAFRLEQEGLLSMVLLPTPRGLMIGQKRAGRK